MRDAGGATLNFAGSMATGDHTNRATVRGGGSGRQEHWQAKEEPPAWQQQHFIPGFIPALGIPARAIAAHIGHWKAACGTAVVRGA